MDRALQKMRETKRIEIGGSAASPRLCGSGTAPGLEKGERERGWDGLSEEVRNDKPLAIRIKLERMGGRGRECWETVPWLVK